VCPTAQASVGLLALTAARLVTFTLTTERKGTQIDAVGHIQVLFSTWNIENPSFAGFVTTQNYGQLEFLLVFNKS